MEGVKEALEWPTNIGKEEHITVTCLYAFIVEISLDSASLCLQKPLSWAYSTFYKKWETVKSDWNAIMSLHNQATKSNQLWRNQIQELSLSSTDTSSKHIFISHNVWVFQHVLQTGKY